MGLQKGKDEATSQHTAGAKGPSRVFQLPGGITGLQCPGEHRGQVGGLGDCRADQPWKIPHPHQGRGFLNKDLPVPCAPQCVC